MKTRLGIRTGQKTLEEESKWHPNMKVRSASKSQFGTFGVPNSTLEGPNFPLLGFGPVTTQGKALATSALYLKRTSHN